MSSNTQIVTFKGSETEYSAEIFSANVIINCSAGTHRNGSSKVKMKSLVDYNWELKYYIGQLVACHVGGKFYAYTLRPKGKLGMLRVVNIETDQRALIKDLSGSIQDISFALTQQPILACIDEDGSVYVYMVEEEIASLKCTLLLHITHPSSTLSTTYRVIWCPYVPALGEDVNTLDDPAKLLAVMNGNLAEIWDLGVINAKYGSGPLEPNEEYEGYTKIGGHNADIIDAAFSPDGTALATASLDGFVKFFQVFAPESHIPCPKCIHKWQPHDGEALSCLLFLDNLKSYANSEIKFWKFAITGANHNSELRVWSCETWKCLQYIRFVPNPQIVTPSLHLKATLDTTAEYLLLSDINCRILYIFKILKISEDRMACVSSVSEFLLPAPIISYGIVNVSAIDNCKLNNIDDDLYEEDDFDEDLVSATAIKMIVVQPKSLQECTVTFKLENSIECSTKSVYGNISEDTAPELPEPELPKLNDLQDSVNLLIKQTSNQLNLMTPEDFTTSPLSSKSLRNSLDIASNLNEEANNTKESNCASGGSSPSREVQKILSLSNPTYTPQECFDDIKLDEDDVPSNEANYLEESGAASTDNVWPAMAMVKAMEVQMSRQKDGDSIESRLLALESVILKQTAEIRALQNEVKNQNVETSMANDVDIRSFFTKEFEKFSAEQRRRDKERDKEQQEIVAKIVTDNVRLIMDDLKNVILFEIKQQVFPELMTVSERLQMLLQNFYTDKLNTFMQQVMNNLNKSISSQGIADCLSKQLIQAIKPSLENCYKEMISVSLIPSWERMCNTMFQQIHTTFTQGTKEYTLSVENYMDRYRKVQEKGNDLINQIQVVSETMRNSSDRLNGISEEVQKQINLSFASLQDRLHKSMAEVIRLQVQQAFRSQQAVIEDSVANAVRSRAVTPSPQVIDTQVQMQQLQTMIMKGNINLAFQQALSASASTSDLTLVMYVCERINVDEVLGPNCILQQPVLLSLIQQLSSDLSTHTETKLKILEGAITNLELNNAITREHVPTVLTELSRQLHNFMVSNPNHKNITQMRLLFMLVKALNK